ncbi:MAG: BTAD domain-containing putative transcriptional regulator [Anaerolineae bacterium]
MNLRLSFLGPFQVTIRGQPARFATARARALLAYLAVEADRPHRREALADLLWPDHPETLGRQNLSQDLARLRRAIHDDGPSPYLQITSTAVQFNSASADVDVAHFQSLMAACSAHRHDAIGSCAACISRLRAAIVLYQGDFLHGFSLKDNQPFNEWSVYKREQLHRQALDALEILVQHALGSTDYAQARQYAQRQVELEPWYEEGHRHLMRALAAMGQRSAALAQYEACRRILAAELRVEPSAETRALYADIRANEGETRPSHRPTQVLPTPLTPFIGRTRELAEVDARLREPGVRLLTLAGIGGMGKTRLAIQVAVTHAESYPDGVYFVPLTPQSEPSTLAPAIANALGVTLHGKDCCAELLWVLKHQKALLILDSLEHLLTSPNQGSTHEVESSPVRAMVELLEGAPGVQVIATSRVRLGVPGENVYVVEGLDYPSQGGVEEVAAAPAVRLLVESARRRDARFTLNASNVASVLRICDLVRGMPLGIELAAAWLEVLTPAEIAAEIEKSADFLADAHGGGPPRRRSLRAVFEWSWGLLNESERQALRRLSVFRGGFTREAAYAVADTSLRDLTGLVYKSLLRWNWTRDAGGYEMHDVVRQFAAEHLIASGEGEALHAAHAAYFCHLAEAAERELLGSEQAQWRNRLVTEQANLRAALSWSLEGGDNETVLRIASALELYWGWQGLLSEGKGWLKHGLVAECGTIPALLRTKALNVQALLAFRQGMMAEAKELAEQALALGETLNDDVATGRALQTLGFVAIVAGDSDAALVLYEQSRARYRRAGDIDRAEAALNNLAMAYSVRGEYDRAKVLFAERTQLARARNDERGASRSVLFWAICACLNGEYEEAAQRLSEAWPVLIEVGDMWNLAYGVLVAAFVMESQGNLHDAARLLGAYASGTGTLSMNMSGWQPYETILAHVQAELAPDTFARAFEAGRALSLDEAVAYARGRLPRHLLA